MANHIRQQLREAFAAQVTGLATSGSRVFQSRIRNLAAADLPGLRIYAEQEDIEDQDNLTSPYYQERTLTLRCEAVAKTTSNLDDTLDTMCKEVEVAIATASALGLSNNVRATLTGTGIDMDVSCEVPAGKAVMVWKIFALAKSNAPDVLI